MVDEEERAVIKNRMSALEKESRIDNMTAISDGDLGN